MADIDVLDREHTLGFTGFDADDAASARALTGDPWPRCAISWRTHGRGGVR